MRAERLCLFPCVSPRPFPYDFTTKAWSTPDGDPRVQGVYHCAASEPSVSAARTQTHADSRCCQEIRATNYRSLLFPSLPRHYIKQTSSRWDPPGPGPGPVPCTPCTPCTLRPALLWSGELVTCAAVTVLNITLISHGATCGALQADNKKVLVRPLTRRHTGYVRPMMSLSLCWLRDETLILSRTSLCGPGSITVWNNWRFITITENIKDKWTSQGAQSAG